ncbi:MAG: hypothetical protein A2021_03760 [Elusimicrobia bacterium GWF2_52_66]|nr:MAG: hypothetical protein A2X33_10045 [Elusimicrobia bacterium GWA2_51_34]OGR84704.1 MAG: hypothetical protein A2021_03760 [Elusimicrobia bacterium GWF2_52_66]
MNHNPSYMRRAMRAAGFIRIAQSKVQYPASYWLKDGVLVVARLVGNMIALKAAKSYVLKNITKDGETFVRELPNIQDALERLGTAHLSISFLGDATDTLSLLRAKEVLKVPVDSDPNAALDFINKAAEKNAQELSYTKSMRELLQRGEATDGVAKGYLFDKERAIKARTQELAAATKERREVTENIADLQGKYQTHGRLSLFRFTYSTPLVVASNGDEFCAALAGILKDVTEVDQFEIKQKLMGAFKVTVSEMKVPSMFFMAEWEAVDSPRQLACLGSAGFEALKREIEACLMLSCNQDIITKEGVVVETSKAMPAKMFQNVLVKLDTAPAALVPTYSLPKYGGLLGFVMEGANISEIPLYYPIKPGITYDSGATRGGKSYVRAVQTENEIAAGVKTILILDPTRQSTGLTKPASDSKVMERYDTLKIPRSYARGFEFRIYTPGSPVGMPLPDDLRDLMVGYSAVTFKDLATRSEDPDLARCTYVRDILQMINNELSVETTDVALSLVIEEAHSCLPGGVRSPEAKAMAGEVLTLITRIAREKCKYGLSMTLISQSLCDYKGAGGRSVRDMVGARFLLKSTDKAELEYVAGFSTKAAAETVKTLNVGEALIIAPGIPGIKTYIRPPLSSVRELSDEEIRAVNQGFGMALRANPQSTANIIYKTDRSPAEEGVLTAAREYLKLHGRAISIPELRQHTGLNGGAWQRVLCTMKAKSLVKTVPLPHTGHGRPALGVIALV